MIAPTSATPASELLGEIVTWDIRSTEVSYEHVRDCLTKAGLDPDSAKEMSTKQAFTRACKHLKENRTIDKIKSKAGVIFFQFTRKVLEGDEIEFDRECRVEVDTDTGQVSCYEKPYLAQQAQELLNHAMQTRNASDITRLIQDLFKSHADLYPINPQKGVAYFVPAAHQDFVEKVRLFVTSLGGCLWPFPVPKGTEQGNASVRDAVSTGLSTLLHELNEAVDGWDDSTRESTMEKVQARYEQVSAKVDAYAEYLLGAQEGLLEQLEAAKARMVDRIIELTEDGEEGALAGDSAEPAVA